MGLYDEFECLVSCPVCGNTVMNTFQTKDFDNTLDVYQPGDHIGLVRADYIRSFRVYTTCDHHREITSFDGELMFISITGVWIEYEIPIKNGIISIDQNKWKRFVEPSKHNALSVLPDGYTEEQAKELVRLANIKTNRDILITKWEKTHEGVPPVE